MGWTSRNLDAFWRTPNRMIGASADGNEPKKGCGAKLIVALATLATIVGGVAAGVQLWSWWGPNPNADLPAGWSRHELQAGVSLGIPDDWVQIDRTTFDTSIRMAWGENAPGNESIQGLASVYYFIPKARSSDAPGTNFFFGAKLRPGPKPDVYEMEARFRSESEPVYSGPFVGKLENLEVIQTQSGPCLRMIFTYASAEAPTQLLTASNIFYLPKGGRDWVLTFTSSAEKLQDDAFTAMGVAKSIRVPED